MHAVQALNSSVSCESIAVPEYQPATERRPLIKRQSWLIVSAQPARRHQQFAAGR